MFSCEFLRKLYEHPFCKTSAAATFAYSYFSTWKRFIVQYFYSGGFRKAI